MTPLVGVRGLEVARGGIPVLQIPRLEIEHGETLAIVGPNGSGKSTILLTLAGLIRPESGQITFNGRLVRNLSDTEYRREIALVMQDPLLFDTTVFANVAVGLRFRGSSTTEILSRVPAWLERLGVAALSTRRSSQLSGGEARRVSLARALVLEPALLLLDEPFSALDPPTRMGILDDFGPLLEGLRTTTVLVTHDLYEARRLADRVAIVIGGRLLQVGSFAELEAAPADEAVAAFLAGASIETASTAVEGSP